MSSTVTPEIKEGILALLEECPSITKCRKVFGIKRAALTLAREKDPKFDQELKDAKADGYDLMELEATRRAVEGTIEPQFYQGEMITDVEGNPAGVRRYSDTLLKFLLTHCKPKKFNPGAKITVGDGEKVSFIFKIGEDSDG